MTKNKAINIAIIVCGGSGTRFWNGLSEKQICKFYIRLNKSLITANKLSVKQNVIIDKNKNLSVIEKTFFTFFNHKLIDFIVIATSSQTDLSIIKTVSNSNRVFFTAAGEERFFTVKLALDFIKNIFTKTSNINVLIHDAARPFISKNLITKTIQGLANNIFGVVPCIKISDTVKNNSNNSVCTIDRSNMYLAQTPQTFCFDKLYDCYQQTTFSKYITDDSSVMEQFFAKNTAIIDGELKNKKITFASDLK